jgi:hypothetical protein
MRDMHKSLQTKTNAVLTLVWGIVAVALVAISSPRPWLLLIVGGSLGALAGLIQARTIRSSASILRGAATLLEVRRALSSTSGGRGYLVLFWGSQVFLALLAAWQFRSNMLLSFVAGYCAFVFWREVTSLPAVVALNRAA